MARITVVNFVSVDGVMQSALSPDEDRDGGFTAGGWVSDRMDDRVAQIMAEATTGASAMLLGRRTYDTFAATWATADPSQPPVAAMNRMPKYVMSRTMTIGQWDGTVVLDDVRKVAQVKSSMHGDIVVFGSGALLPSLFEAGLVDEVRLLVFPLVIGTGKRMFAAPCPGLDLSLTHSEVTSSGVIVLTYDVG